VRRALVLLLALTAAAPAKPSAEEKYRSKLADVWVEFGRYCKLEGLKADAESALARARALDPQAKDLDRLAGEVEALDGDKERPAGFGKRREKAHKEAAKICDRLAKLGKEPRYELYALDALALDPSSRRLGKLAGEAQKGLAVIKHPDHPLVGYVSLPKGWSRKKKYPVLITVDGAGSNFLGSGRRFATTRGSRKYIVLAPCTLSNTNELLPKKYPYYTEQLLQENNGNRIAFDLAGVEKLLAFVEEHLGGSGKIAVTGFSGGGNVCYAMTVVHPGQVLFSAPACANFSGMGFDRAKKPDDGGPPIRILTGDKDPHREWTHGKVGGVPGIEPQTDRAVEALKELGYTNFTRTMLKGVGHSNCAAEVWKVADEIGG
jgi:dienelactone hydrolase